MLPPTYPAYPIFLPGNEAMIRDVEGSKAFITDAHECCCEEVWTTTPPPGVSLCPPPDWCLANCAERYCVTIAPVGSYAGGEFEFTRDTRYPYSCIWRNTVAPAGLMATSLYCTTHVDTPEYVTWDFIIGVWPNYQPAYTLQSIRYFTECPAGDYLFIGITPYPDPGPQTVYVCEGTTPIPTTTKKPRRGPDICCCDEGIRCGICITQSAGTYIRACADGGAECVSKTGSCYYERTVDIFHDCDPGTYRYAPTYNDCTPFEPYTP